MELGLGQHQLSCIAPTPPNLHPVSPLVAYSPPLAAKGQQRTSSYLSYLFVYMPNPHGQEIARQS
jgi:hypothetical protein